MDISSSIPLDRVTGLRPRVWLSVGAGFAREDIKALLLSQGRGFVGDAVTSLQEICIKILGLKKDCILGSFTRQEILRLLLSESRIMSKMPEITRIRRQKSFIRRLDHAFQTARLAFAHDEEEEVYHQRLEQQLGVGQLRNELRILSKAYEAWLIASDRLDLPLLMRKATEVLREKWPPSLTCPEEIWLLSVQTPESLETEFWEVLGHYVPVRQIKSLGEHWQGGQNLHWHQWHTLDDAAEYLGEMLAQKSPQELSQCAVLMPDIPTIRRSLMRTLGDRKIPLADLRDPTRLKWDESLKQSLLTLQVVASQYERKNVISWLKRYQSHPEFSKWIIEINSRGIRRGLKRYSGGNLAEVFLLLQNLENRFGGKKKCTEIAREHIQHVREEKGKDSRTQWLVPFFESIWNGMAGDLEKLGQDSRKAPLFYWLERLQSRIAETSPPVDRTKSQSGLQIYRLGQAPVAPVPELWIFGLPSNWFSGKGVGGYWLSDWEREILSTEFSIRSPRQMGEERLGILKSWVLGSEQTIILDAHYSADGREKESLLPILKSMSGALGKNISWEAIDKGSHPRFLSSYGIVKKAQPQEVQLPQLAQKEMTATTLDRYSRCSFQALGFHRWNLSDLREPDMDLWPDVRGNILHEAVRLILQSRNKNGNYIISTAEALEIAWMSKPPKGLLNSERIESYLKGKLLKVLEAFCEKESGYFERSEAEPISLDNLPLRLEYPDLVITGKADRIDQHHDGLFVMDYKTSGALPHGIEMVELGYRLQLPFYAVAIERQLNQPVLGVQFIELDRKGARKSGIFFQKWNGKNTGSLTQARSNSKSLFSKEPQEVWKFVEGKIKETGSKYLEGYFIARPNLPQRERECSRCTLADLCGFRRLGDGDGLQEESHA